MTGAPEHTTDTEAPTSDTSSQQAARTGIGLIALLFLLPLVLMLVTSIVCIAFLFARS